MSEGRVTSMNDLEKKSFYTFLALYLVSSFFFVVLSAFWYYSAQKNSLESETYYKLTHIADKLSSRIINAQMKGESLSLPNEKGYEYKLIPLSEKTEYKSGYFDEEDYKILVSSAPQEHLNIKYVLIKTKLFATKLEALKQEVFTFSVFIFASIVFIAIILARLFMKPVHKRIEQIESFIQDVSHELNTPITALKMSSSRAIQKKIYDKKILTNISISTKQLESIYKSLTYLNFSDKQEEPRELDLAVIVQRVVNYYGELCLAKEIEVRIELKTTLLNTIESKMELLFSNLLSNAIKYSMPNTSINITLNEGVFIIKDEGVGIASDKLNAIFELYNRDSSIAGGFGVGLNIVKQICDENGIKIFVHSELDKGSKFRLVFTL
jgi:two-component system, OmpR family, sensor kinase